MILKEYVYDSPFVKSLGDFNHTEDSLVCDFIEDWLTADIKKALDNGETPDVTIFDRSLERFRGDTYAQLTTTQVYDLLNDGLDSFEEAINELGASADIYELMTYYIVNDVKKAVTDKKKLIQEIVNDINDIDDDIDEIDNDFIDDDIED